MSKISDLTEKYRALVDDETQPVIATNFGPVGMYDELFGELYSCQLEFDLLKTERDELAAQLKKYQTTGTVVASNS